MERCRTELLRAQGLEQDKLIAQADLIFAVRKVQIEYFSPARFNDRLVVTAGIDNAHRVKVTFKQKIHRLNDMNTNLVAGFIAGNEKLIDSQLLCEADIDVIALCAQKMKPKRMPQNIYEELIREH